MKKSTLSVFAACSTLVLLTACGGSTGATTDTGANNGSTPNTTVEEPTETSPENSNDFTSQPAVDADGVYDLGRYLLSQQTGTMVRDLWQEEAGSLTSNGQANIQVDAPMQPGEWINDEIGFGDSMKISAYRVNDNSIDVTISVLNITNNLNLKRFVTIGENAAGADAPFNTTMTLREHNNQFATVMAGTVQRTDTDVLTLEANVEASAAGIGLDTQLDINLSRDLGVVSGVDRDCVTTLFGIETGVNDNLADSQCAKIRTDYIILDSQIIRR